VVNPVESTKYSRATTVVYTHEYPINTGQMSRLNARCLPIRAWWICLLFYVCIVVVEYKHQV